jgi:hypothetical protein
MMITPALHIANGQQEVPQPTSNHQGFLETSGATNLSNLPTLSLPSKAKTYQKFDSSKPSKSTKFF